jgi:hypothetical protein
MILDLESGRYVFEVVLGYEVDDEVSFTIPYVLQANNPVEAEEKIQDYLEEHGVVEAFWIEELSDPYEVQEYLESLEDNGDEAHILLEALAEEDFQDILRG